MMQHSAARLDKNSDMPTSIAYPDGSMAALVQQAVNRYASLYAYECMGKRVRYAAFWDEICRCARALKALGVQPEERITICMPNLPQAVVMLYAVNLVGAVANMVNPLSGEEELVYFLNLSGSRRVLTLDRFYPKFAAIRHKVTLDTLLLTRVGEALPRHKKLVYALTEGRRDSQVPRDTAVVWWRDFLAKGDHFEGAYAESRCGDDAAVILYSGGTTGTSKGVLLTNRNMNAAALQTCAAGNCGAPHHRMLAVMPLFHGFGLGVCVHTTLTHGANCVLVPRFHLQSYPKLLRRSRPHYLVGVPTLFEALLRHPAMKRVDLSELKGVFCGGDALSAELKYKVDRFLRERGATVTVREGYGLTECVTAGCLTPRDVYKEGSIGLPFPDMIYQIVSPQTEETLPCGEIGEICISGPTVMRGYVDQPEETAQTLRTHADGRLWLHTGDLGCMDEDGFVYFKQRLKRMIVTSGYNVYPSQVERVIDTHEAVQYNCVIGIKDAYRMQRVKAFVVLEAGYTPSEELKASLAAHCRRYMARYAVPSEFVFREELPLTRLGKVAYTELERQEEQNA